MNNKYKSDVKKNVSNNMKTEKKNWTKCSEI